MKHTVIAIAHWVFYTLVILPVILINAESWLFGIKFSGWEAITLHILIGGVGIVIGCFIYKKQKYFLWAGLGLAVFDFTGIFINYLTA